MPREEEGARAVALPGVTLKENGSRQGQVRGTQTFVGVMAAVWKRPSLTLREVIWRWSVGLPLLALAWYVATHGPARWAVVWVSLQSASVFQPVAALATIGAVTASLLPNLKPFATRVVPLSLLAWAAAGAWGGNRLLLALDARLRPRLGAAALLRLVREALLLLVLIFWSAGVVWAGRVAITGPASSGAEPNLVLYAGLVICGSLALYAGWGVASWALHFAVIRSAMPDRGTRRIPRELRGKLIELNLVMHIVRITLLVLAMVASASPLPFTSVATQGFLECWWGGVAVLWLLASDYFHVVRIAAYLSLAMAYDFSGAEPAAGR